MGAATASSDEGDGLKRFDRVFDVGADDVDELGHVNNAVWVRWVQDIAVAHWRAVAPSTLLDAVYWVVTRHEVDYRANVGPGARVIAETWVGDAPKGARFDRFVRFADVDGRLLVEARTTWAMVDAATGRLRRIRPPDIAFLS